MNIAIYGRPTQSNNSEYIQQFFDLLAKAEYNVIIHKDLFDFLSKQMQLPANAVVFEKSLTKKQADCLISLGGDGTLLETVALLNDSGIPVLGINTGRLGFLSSIAKEDVGTVVELLQKNSYSIENRTLIQIESDKKLFGKVNYGLNEITIVKKDTSSMITIHAYLNGDYLNSYWADGLIIATPTGSTAYPLSCGGPIVMPGSSNFVITPIAPHNLNVRPVVVSDSCNITLKVEGRSANFLVSLDSRSEIIDSSLELTIHKAAFSFPIIKLHSQNFLTTIRNKLMWGIDKRNE